MSGLAVVSSVVEVQDHPNEEKAHLGVFILNTGGQLIGVNNEDGSRRFNVGDFLIHVRPGAIIPEHIVKNGFENVKGGKIKASRFAGVESEGIMLNLDRVGGNWTISEELLSDDFRLKAQKNFTTGATESVSPIVYGGEDVSDVLGIV